METEFFFLSFFLSFLLSVSTNCSRGWEDGGHEGRKKRTVSRVGRLIFFFSFAFFLLPLEVRPSFLGGAGQKTRKRRANVVCSSPKRKWTEEETNKERGRLFVILENKEDHD